MLSGHRTFVPRWGVAITRVTVGERFGSAGVQAEAEAYPRAGRLGYVYSALAVSPHEAVFIPVRAALELFGSLRSGLELSGGARLFHTEARSTVAYTGSVGVYRGSYWVALRPYLVRQNDALSTTGQLSIRRYWAGRHDYVGIYLSATRGADPTVDDPLRIGRDPALTSFSARVERLRPFRAGRLRVGSGLGIESEEVTPSNRRLHLLATFRLERVL